MGGDEISRYENLTFPKISHPPLAAYRCLSAFDGRSPAAGRRQRRIAHGRSAAAIHFSSAGRDVPEPSGGGGWLGTSHCARKG
jgi:hypothetical protein